MDPSIIVGLLILGIVAGIVGSLFGIGGGIIFIPVLTIVYDLPAMEAAAISLIGILALSAGAASYYTEHKVANVRLGLFLEIGTTIGAIAGAFLAGMVEQWVLFTIFSIFVIINGFRMLFSHGKDCGREAVEPKASRAGRAARRASCTTMRRRPDRERGEENEFKFKRRNPFAFCERVSTLDCIIQRLESALSGKL